MFFIETMTVIFKYSLCLVSGHHMLQFPIVGLILSQKCLGMLERLAALIPPFGRKICAQDTECTGQYLSPWVQWLNNILQNSTLDQLSRTPSPYLPNLTIPELTRSSTGSSFPTRLPHSDSIRQCLPISDKSPFPHTSHHPGPLLSSREHTSSRDNFSYILFLPSNLYQQPVLLNLTPFCQPFL